MASLEKPLGLGIGFWIIIPTLIGGLFYALDANKQQQEKALTLEITPKDYFSVLNRYKYLSGSEMGNNFKSKTKDALMDNQITRREYLKLMKSDPEIFNIETPENNTFYEKSKPELINLVKAIND